MNYNIIDKIIYIQRFIKSKLYIFISSKLQTKDWRKQQYWYNTGKKNECEKYQKKSIEFIFNIKLQNTNERLSISDYKLVNIRNILNLDYAFDLTENFDGKLSIGESVYYFNLKFVCDKGGAQTRSLREVYHFIKAQLEFLNHNQNQNIYFINILDGDTAFNNINKFRFLIEKSEYKEYTTYLFCGDSLQFKDWFHSILNT